MIGLETMLKVFYSLTNFPMINFQIILVPPPAYQYMKLLSVMSLLLFYASQNNVSLKKVVFYD